MSPREGLRQQQESAARTAVGWPLAPAPATGVPERLRNRQPEAERFWRAVRRRRMLAFADVGAGIVASLLVAGSAPRAVWALALIPGWVVIAKLFGLYDRDQRSIRHLTVDELSSIAAWAAAGVGILGLLLPLTPAGSVSFGVLASTWLVVTVVAALLRGTMRLLWRLTTPPELTAVLGDGELASAARRKVELFRDMHLRLVEDGPLPLGATNNGGGASLRDQVLGLDRARGTVAWRGVSITVQPLRAASSCSDGLSPATQISGRPFTGRAAMCVSGSLKCLPA